MTPVAHSSAVLVYDAYGNRTSRTVRSANGETTEERRSYDKYSRLVEISSFGSSVKYRYDAKGRIARQTVDGSPIDFAYTKYGRLAGKYLGGREKPDAAVEYEYSKSGQIVARIANGVRQTYEYDGRGQLLAVKENGADVERYVYDKAGNMVKKTLRLGRAHTPSAPQYQITTFTFDGANQLVSSTTDGVTTKYAYDAAGRLVKEGNRTYRYGYLDKVLSVTEGAQTYTYDYHVDGQLARADYGKGGTRSVASASEDFLWDGLALIKRGDERFVNEPHVGGGNPVASSKGTTYFNDILGTTVGAKKGAKYSAAALTAFGESFPASQPLNTSTSQQFYTGKPHVAGLGHAFLMRNYRAGLAKWQTADPIGYPDGWNQLAYCGNSPYEFFDFQGTSIFDGYFDDQQGVTIFNRWLEGDGSPLISWGSQFWGDYMKSNQRLAQQVHDFLYADAVNKYVGGNCDFSFHAEIENGYRTGYEMLHGTVKPKGDFQISGIFSVEYVDGKRIVTYNIWEIWNDIIDPNFQYRSDELYSRILNGLYSPKNYDIQLAWMRTWKFVFE